MNHDISPISCNFREKQQKSLGISVIKKKIKEMSGGASVCPKGISFLQQSFRMIVVTRHPECQQNQWFAVYNAFTKVHGDSSK